jgi:hypothetical protein
MPGYLSLLPLLYCPYPGCKQRKYGIGFQPILNKNIERDGETSWMITGAPFFVVNMWVC